MSLARRGGPLRYTPLCCGSERALYYGCWSGTAHGEINASVYGHHLFAGLAPPILIPTNSFHPAVPVISSVLSGASLLHEQQQPVEISPQAQPPRSQPAPPARSQVDEPSQLPAAPCKPFLPANRGHVGAVFIYMWPRNPALQPPVSSPAASLFHL